VNESDGNTRWEEMRVTGDQLVSTVKDLVREGNIRRIVIKNDEGRVYLEIPLTVGVVGAVFLPVLAAVGALAAVAGGLTIAVEKIVPAGGTPDAPGPAGPTGQSGTASTGAGPNDPTGDDGPG
jgi:Domain of unknown function (DUF4342)